MGRVKGQLHSETPIPGGNLRLSLEGDVQRAGAAALSGQGLPGAFVVMDIDEGEILGLGSSPTFDPTVFTRPLTHRAFDALNSEESGAPMTHRGRAGEKRRATLLRVERGGGRAAPRPRPAAHRPRARGAGCRRGSAFRSGAGP